MMEDAPNVQDEQQRRDQDQDGRDAGRGAGEDAMFRALREANVVLMQSDDESDDEQARQGQGHAGEAPQRVPLHHFLRIIAGGRLVMDAAPANSNEDLLAGLKEAGALTTDAVSCALRLCPRDAFVPERYADEAFIDSPIRLEEYDFNISAPHMHATCLEALSVRPGDRCLDVGCGSGVLAAAMAVLAGPLGGCAGIDTRKAAVKLSKRHVRRLAENSEEFVEACGQLRFELHNVFIPSVKHMGMYDKVHVGASCHPSKLHHLLALLKPDATGVIVTPVAPNDLRVITRHPCGRVTQRVISQVRYGELDVPSDLEILTAKLELERAKRTAAPSTPSMFADDVAQILTCAADAGHGTPSPGSSLSDASPLARFHHPAWQARAQGQVPTSPIGIVPRPIATSTVATGPTNGGPAGAHGPRQYGGGYGAGSMSSGASGSMTDGHFPHTPRSPQPDSARSNNGCGGSANGGAFASRMARLFSACARPSGAKAADTARWDASGASPSAQAGGAFKFEFFGVPAEHESAATALEAAARAALESAYGGPAKGAVECEALGAPECMLVGDGWGLPVHRAVLRVRCDTFRARCDSGMRDAGEARLQVPDHFSLPAMRRFLYYLYHDTLGPAIAGGTVSGVSSETRAHDQGGARGVKSCRPDEMHGDGVAGDEGDMSSDGMHGEGDEGDADAEFSGAVDPGLAMELLHVAHYYGATRLASLCEGLLAEELRGRDGDDEGACHAAPVLLALAHEFGGLPHLQSIALDFIVHNHTKVSVTDSYRALTKEQTDVVAAAAADAYARLREEVTRMAAPVSLPEPNPRTGL